MTAHSRIEADPVEIFWPNDAPGDKLLRRKLVAGQPWAAAHATQAQSATARSLLMQICDLCGQWAFAPATTDQLCDVVQAVGYMRKAAATFERVEGGGT